MYISKKFSSSKAIKVSLYPWCNFTGPYPVKHPTIIRPETQKVEWTHPEDVPYEGLIKCKIVPPKGLYLPVIPVKIPSYERLLFPLCVKCASKFKDPLVDIKYDKYNFCPHSDEERSFTTTISHLELKEALLRNYRFQIEKKLRLISIFIGLQNFIEHGIIKNGMMKFLKNTCGVL